MKLREFDDRELEDLERTDLEEAELEEIELEEAKTEEARLDEWDISRKNSAHKRVKSGKERTKPGSHAGRRQVNIWPALLAVLGCIALILLFVYLGMSVRMKETEADMAISDEIKETYTREEVDALVSKARETARQEEAQRILGGISQNLSQGMAVAKALRPFYPNDVVVAADGRVQFFPIQESLKKNTYSAEQLVKLDNGELQYVENDQVISHKGIDVSYHQGEIEWEQVAQDGVEFAFIRVGLRGYGTGRVVLDEQFENNVKGALGNGIKVGVYFYSQSVNEEEVLEEASLVLEQIAPYKVTGPVVYDAEKVSNSRTSSLTVEERTAMALAFCRKVEEAGYRPMIYLNLDTAFTMVDLTQLEDYDKWFAHYGTDMYYPYDYKIWQYTEKGSVKGISTEVDLNISFEEWE